MTNGRICYRKLYRYKYQLMELYKHATSLQGHDVATSDDWVVLKQDGTLTLKKGYSWDGPSGPTIDTKNFMRGSLVHDGLYQLIREQLIPAKERKPADEILRKICRQDGMSAIRAWWVYHGVRIGGRFAARPTKPNPPIYAP